MANRSQLVLRQQPSATANRLTRRACFRLGASLVCAATFVAAPVRAQETLTLGPGMMTFPEIARAVSTPEQPVTCSPKVQHRAALVYLKNRSRADVMRLLSQALDVQFTKQRPDASGAPNTTRGLILQADTATTFREERWRKSLADQMSAFFAKVENNDKELLRRYGDKSLEELEAASNALSKEAGSLYKTNPDANSVVTVDGGYIDKADQPRLEQISQQQSEIFRVRWLRAPQASVQLGWEVHRQMVSKLGVAEVVNRGRAQQWFPVTTLPESLVRQTVEENGKKGREAAAIIAQMSLRREANQVYSDDFIRLVDRDGDELNVLRVSMGQISCYSGRGSSTSLADEVFAGMKTSVSGLEQSRLPLPSDARTWLKGQQQATRAYLASERAALPLKALPSGMAGVLSQYVDAYRQEQDAEIVMELWPSFEAVDDGDPVNTARSLRQVQPSFASWTFAETDGVLMVKNQLAFLDRVPARPVAALVEFLRAAEKHQAARQRIKSGAKPGEALPVTARVPLPLPISAVADYNKSAQKLAYWTTFTVWLPPFWRVRLETLDMAQPGLCVWNTLTDEQKTELRQEGQLSLGKVEAKALRQAGVLLRDYAYNFAVLSQKDVVSFLKQGELTRGMGIVCPPYHLMFTGTQIDWDEFE